MLLLEITKAFQDEGIDFVILGGYAVALHGVVRGTVDIDLALALTQDSFTKAEMVLTSMGFMSRLPVKSKEMFQFRNEYAENRNLIAWSFYDPINPIRQIDILTLIDARKIKKTIKKVHGSGVPIASLPDLIRIKKASARPQDLEDVKALELLKRS